jgi:uncharacterized protein (DUF885 family)
MRHRSPHAVASSPPQAFRSLAVDHRPVPTTHFEHVLREVLDDLFRDDPVFATQIGHHAEDHRWPDLTPTGRLKRIEMLRRHRATVEALDEEELSPDERIDRRIVLEALDATLFGEETLREATWDPLSYVYLLGTGFFALLGRDYAPFAHRGQAFLFRMRAMPQVFEAARQNLLGLPGRPVSLLHTETALSQLEGLDELIEEAIARAQDDPDPDKELDLERRLREEAPAAREAISDFRRFLEDEARSRAREEGRLGVDLFREKLRHTLASDLSPGELLARARSDYEVVRGEMIRLARELWPSLFPAESMPGSPRRKGSDADADVVRRVLDAIAGEHRRPEELLDYCREEVGRIERFVRRKRLVGLPREPLNITWTPTFMRAYGGAFLDSPGPLDKGQSSYFWITPPGDDWPAERVESYLREDNDRMLRLLCVHESIPGHYLQLAWSNRSPSLARAVFSSGMFAEGWAVYVTQVMTDVGYGRRDPALLLTHWKFYLRAIINAIVDVGIHTREMPEDEAMTLMVEGGFQEEQEARAKYLRARLTSTQLSTYYLGSLEMWDLELQARRRAAESAGASADSIPRQAVVGGLGDTPGWDYRRHLESVISHGTPPIKYVAEILASS